MENSQKINFKQKLSNFFGSLGYISCVGQWFWAILLYYSYLIGLVAFITPNPVVEVVDPQPIVSQPQGPLMFVIGAIFLVAMVVLTIYVIVKMPSMISKTSQKIVHKSADSMAPALLHMQNKKETKKNKIKLTFGLILVIKAVLIIIPIAASYFSQYIENQTFGFDIAMHVSLFLAGCSLVFFAIQYALARVFSTHEEDII